jgi:hypothetical protein
MVNDFKPTHDPGLDTFKVQYLLAGSAILAILFPYEYKFSEVRDQLCLPAKEEVSFATKYPF